MCDASNKMRIKIFSVGGYVIMFTNNEMETATGILRSFEKITKVFSSNLTAVRFSLQQVVADCLTKQTDMEDEQTGFK